MSVVLLVGSLGAGPVQAAKPPRVRGCRVFPAFKGSPTARSAANQSAWNQRVSRAPIDPNSADYLARISGLGGNQVVHPDFGGNGRYGIPYTTVRRDQRRVRVTVTGYPNESDFGLAPVPPNAPIENGSDRHVLVLQRHRCDLFEMFDARYAGGPGNRWRASSTARFDLGSRRLRADGWTSADAAGLPILPGLVRYGEVRRGRVRHAIRVTFAETRRAYVHPATHYASSQCNPNLPPMGLRLRLRRSYFVRNLHRFRRGSQSRVIFKALYRYGAITADNGGSGSNWFITGASSKRWRDGDLNHLKTVPGTAFAVIDSRAPVRTPC
ncbi:MAG TPA: hypothetical protein VN458_01210 [Solirubrobacterales bacterium]|nr:hypothetical protein [Solirubrobacterales bacterium]